MLSLQKKSSLVLTCWFMFLCSVSFNASAFNPFSFIGDTVNSITNVLGQGVNTLINTGGNVISSGVNVITSGINTITSGISSVTTGVNSVIANSLNQIGSNLEDVQSNFGGNDIFSGIMYGFFDKALFVINIFAPQTPLSNLIQGTDGIDQDELQILTNAPNGFENKLPNYYTPVKYMYMPKYDVYILGTEKVHDWTLINSYAMIYRIIESLRSSEHQSKFIGHQVFVITDDEVDVPFTTLPGHKNTGNPEYTIFNQQLICATAQDTLYPNIAPAWRAWDTPIHEFGHAIEHALALEDQSDTVFSQDSNYNPDGAVREWFSWTTERWFDAALKYSPSRQFRNFPKRFIREYFEEIFTQEFIWKPSCEGRPFQAPQ